MSAELHPVFCVCCGVKVYDVEERHIPKGLIPPKDLLPQVACGKCSRTIANVPVTDFPDVPGETLDQRLARLEEARKALRARLPVSFGHSPGEK